MKICTKCNKEKEYTEFHKHKFSKDGYKCHCKICIKDYRNRNIKREKEYYLSMRDTEEYKQKRRENAKIFREKHRDKIRERKRIYRLNKRKTDPLFAMKKRLRNRVYQSFTKRYWKKNNTTESILGCDYKTAFNHIESQFKEGMSWENRSEWHIDHIIPLASAKNEEELIKLCHYTNLQPLWAEENLKKSDKIQNSYI